MSKFNIGDKVRVLNRDSNEEFIIGGIIEKENSYDDYYYQYKLKNMNESSELLKGMFNEEDLEIIQETKQEMRPELKLFTESLYQEYYLPESTEILLSNKKSKYRTGDIVNVHGYEDLQCVKEVIEHSDGQFQYDIVPLSNEDFTYRFEESFLEFQYHDPNYEIYYMESYNGLPPWRGEIYDVYTLYVDPETHRYDTLNEERIKEYENHIIPPVRMQHILHHHSIYDRIDDVLKEDENKKRIMKNLNITNNDIERLKASIRQKINYRNLDYMYKDLESKHKKFSKLEYQFAAEVNELDKTEDHYPLDMTNLQIMQAIKEAYDDNNAKKISRRKIQPNDDKYGKSAPNRGKIIYEGFSKKGLKIQFYYNFDWNMIEAAYPVAAGDRSKKHKK